jgi:hypothetical protein
VIKTLLIASTPPGSKGVGDIYLENLCSQQPEGSLVRVSIVKKSQILNLRRWLNFDGYNISVRKSHLPLLSSLMFLFFKMFYKKNIVRQITEIVRVEKIEKLWLVLSSPELILIAEELSENINVQIYVSIWDSPIYFKENLHLDWLTYSIIKKAFDSVLNKSKHISVIDDGMKEKLCSKHISKTFVIRNGIDANTYLKNNINDPQKLKIVFAGSIYAKLEWNKFILALKKINFTINNKKIELVNFGRLPRFGIIRDERINFRGLVSLEEVMSELAEADIGYVPYWFASKKSEVVETSFPGKVSAYVAAGVKVFFHGPANSSVISFIDKWHVGINCTSLDEIDIIHAIDLISQLNVEDNDLEGARKSLSQSEMLLSFNAFIK